MISKKDSENAIAERNKGELERIEKELDAAIVRGGSVAVDVGFPPKAVLDQLRRKYELGGWTVKVTKANQRDGVFFELS